MVPIVLPFLLELQELLYHLYMIDQLRQHLHQEGSLTLMIRLHPGARTTLITGVMSDGSLKLSVRAPADKGHANMEMIRFLAEELQVPRSSIQILSGTTERRKVVRIALPSSSS